MPARTITAADLVRRLESGETVRVVDMRPAEQRADWWIPRSAHAPGAAVADAARGAGPVVVACAAGRESADVAGSLVAQGIDAVSLAGGMRAWSLAHVARDVPLARRDVEVVQVARVGKGCLSHVVASARECVVVDACVNPAVYVDLARARGWRIARVVDTHLHADHLTRGPDLARLAGATYHMPVGADVATAYAPLADGDEMPVGDVRLRVVSTPGHARVEASLVLDDAFALTGDTLLADGVGRPDLGASAEESRRRAAQLHASVARLAALSPRALVLPGHAGSVPDWNDLPVRAALADALRRAPPLADEAAFVHAVLADLPPPPPEHDLVLEMNRAGVCPDDDEAVSYEAGANRCSAGRAPSR